MWTDLDRRAASVASQQHGLLHRSDLRILGIGDAAVRRRVSLGLLIRRGSAVFAYAGTPSYPRQSLLEAVFSVGHDALLSHDSAAFEWELIQRLPRIPHVALKRWNRTHQVSVAVHESLDLEPSDYAQLDGIPLTHPVRTVVDLGATSPWLVERALSAGLRADLFSVADIDMFVERVAKRGRAGVGVIRPLLDMHRAVGGQTESLLEDRFLRILFDRGVDLPTPQYDVLDETGLLICRSDFAYPWARLLIEVDGRSYHSDSVAFQRDREKQNCTQELGWTTLRFTWHDVHREPDRVATTVSSWLESDRPVLAYFGDGLRD